MRISNFLAILLRIPTRNTCYSTSTGDRGLLLLTLLTAIAVLVLLCGILVSSAPAIVFTGDAESDFASSSTAVAVPDSSTAGAPPIPDVGLPPGSFEGLISGWDIKTGYFDYDSATDTLFVGVDFFTIAGDADDDGDPGATSPDLDDRGGQDLPNLAATETILVVFDLDQNGAPDIGAGVPSSLGSMLDPTCPDYGIDDCSGLFDVVANPTNAPPFVPLARRSETATLFASPSGAEPDFELSIPDWSSILPADVCGPWSVDVNIFAGSFQDDGIGEDTLPNSATFASLDFPGTAFEICRSLRTAVIAGTEDVTLGRAARRSRGRCSWKLWAQTWSSARTR